MFHTLLTLAYIIPNIYVFLRIRSLFISKGKRFLYSVIYIFLVLIYPAGNLLGGHHFILLKEILTRVSNYILPFYLYLFLSILLLDILLLINRLIKLVPREKLGSRGFRKYGLLSVFALSAAVVIAGIINFNTIRVSEYTVNVPARSSEIEKLKIAFVADFHLNPGTDTAFVGRFVRKVDEIHPDIMIYGGDIIEGTGGAGSMRPFERMLSQIRPVYGVYAVLGNHEHYAGQDRGRFFKRAGMILLRDSDVVVDHAFNIAGRNDSHVSGRATIEELLEHVNDSLPVILVDHRPTEIDLVSRTPVDIQLSGHTHNGQLFPINLITRSVYILSWGHRKIGKTDLFVTSGIRLWGPPVRTTGKSEIMVINVNFVKN